MYEKFLPVVQTMIDSVQLNTSDMSSMENLDRLPLWVMTAVLQTVCYWMMPFHS